MVCISRFATAILGGETELALGTVRVNYVYRTGIEINWLIRHFLIIVAPFPSITPDNRVCVCVPMPTHCTISCFGFRSRQIDGVGCDLFSIHAPLGQTTLRVGQVSVWCTVGS